MARFSKLRDGVGGHDWVNLEMYLKALIQVTLEMHLEASLEQHGGSTWELLIRHRVVGMPDWC